ncbi:hypothetical protein OB919_13900 [Halobacteria archaeon AArc-curdl1]|uniref:CHAT domain-containing protein n=1 Tax=Natronosalvus hydrolyticus TaxID=2979988 RepID=A0AAP3E8A0_9EURY|nr:hypothetical protein [Halobacteria archaeon AArc-curdl1]
MEAISMAAATIKSQSPERSWPTFRGHPPLIERGETLEIPDTLSVPQTSSKITVPPAYETVYPVSPLAYYLGATIEPGPSAAIETDRTHYPLGTERSLEADIERILQKVFVLDCFVRSNGIVKDRLLGHDDLDDALTFDIAETYSLSLSRRLDRYLDVSDEVIEPYVPPWPATAHVPATPETVELLPYLLGKLTHIKTIASTNSASDGHQQQLTGINSERPGEKSDSIATDILQSSTRFEDPESGIQLLEGIHPDSLEAIWFGDGITPWATRGTIEAYRGRLEGDDVSDKSSIRVVCNESPMLPEIENLEGLYGERDSHPFDVRVEYGVSTDRLATLLRSESVDLFHFIGHATPEGLICHDGALDVRTLESVAPRSFMLNACQSAQQGLALVERGANCGLATHSDVVNQQAIRASETVVRFLSRGFMFRSALWLTRLVNPLDEYVLLGDGTLTIAPTDGGAPTIYVLDSFEEPFDLCHIDTPILGNALGATTGPTITDCTFTTLIPSAYILPNVTRSQLREALQWTAVPILCNETFHWPSDVGIPETLLHHFT